MQTGDLDDAASIVRQLGSTLDTRQVAEEVGRLTREIPDHAVGVRWDGVRRPPRLDRPSPA
jgi:hypothetical protein